MKKLLFALTGLVLLVAVTGCGNNQDDKSTTNTSSTYSSISASDKSISSEQGKDEISTQESTIVPMEDIAANITWEEAKLEDRFLFFVKNSNPFAVKVILRVFFYDENGTKVGQDKTEILGIPGNNEVVTAMKYQIPPMQTEPLEYAKLEVEISGSKMDEISQDSVYELQPIDVEIQEKPEALVATFTSQNEFNIRNVDTTMVFYKEGVPVGYSRLSFQNLGKVPPKVDVYKLPQNSDGEWIEFDEYRLFFNTTQVLISDMK